MPDQVRHDGEIALHRPTGRFAEGTAAVGKGYSVFISGVTREFGAARDALANALQARGIEVKVQRSFDLGDDTTLAKLHGYIRGCDRVIALIGAYSGMFPPEGAVTDEFRAMLPAGMTRASLTQWEVVFARHYGRQTYFFEAAGFAPEQPPSDGDDPTAQSTWRDWLFDEGIGRDRRQFQTADGLRADVMELEWPNLVRPKPSNLPGSIGRLFKGREDFLRQLRESFRHNAATAITGKAVHGLGGVGKTRAAIEYGHAHAEDYAATLYLIGKSESDLGDSLAALAGPSVLDLAEKDVPNLDARVAAVIRWLRTNPGWLLIIDNVDDEAAAGAVRAFLDQVSRADGHVLITSRMSAWGNIVEPLELDLLSVDAAKDLLRESTPHRTKRADEDAALTRLADEQLGCLSLALVQAAAYIEERRIGFADYGALFEKEAKKLLAKLGEAAVRNLSYPLPVALTWQASIAQLSDQGRLLLDMLAWLSIEPIPRSLFAIWPEAETVDLEEGLAELTRYSFVRWEAENSAITLHRLVAQVTRDNLSSDARDRALGALFPWLYAVNPEMNAGDVRCWPQLVPLLPHALFLFEQTRHYGPYGTQTHVYDEYATLLQSLARYSEAEAIFRCSLAIDEAQHGPNHPAVAADLNNLALLLTDSNRLAETEPLLRRALAIDEAHYGPNHPTVATCLNSLAGLLKMSKRLDEAEPLYRRALAIDEANHGPDDWHVANRLSNLAALLVSNRRLMEAEPLSRRALAIIEASHGPDHPFAAICLNNLASILLNTNQAVEAEPLYRRAALILLRSSKETGHLLPNTAGTLANYATALSKAGLARDDAHSIISSVMTEGGFDPTELWPRVFGKG